ncbi:MAG: RNA pyrophosphohydrolase [Minwuiales bacterium]|nr:RNA pyrophosphohydrolase [Minwuiales bacterium]
MTDKKDAASLPYRPCVGIMLLNGQGQVFVGRRIDQTVEAWQMPQGGIDAGEEPRDAALRELKEEIGTDQAEILAESRDWLKYDLPANLIGKVWRGRYRGQTQKWFAMRFLGAEADIDIDTEHPEFQAWRWLAMDDLLQHIVPFKYDVYARVVAEFRHLSKQTRT